MADWRFRYFRMIQAISPAPWCHRVGGVPVPCMSTAQHRAPGLWHSLRDFGEGVPNLGH